MLKWRCRLERRLWRHMLDAALMRRCPLARRRVCLLLAAACRRHFFVRPKKLMQAPPSLLGLGSSPTNSFAYSVWLHAKVLVVCANRWGLGLETPPAADHEWLLTNAVVVRVGEPLFLS